MVDRSRSMQKETHPLVSADYLSRFVGRLVAIVGRVAKPEMNGILTLEFSSGSQVRILKFKTLGGERPPAMGSIIEVRGFVNKDMSVTFGEMTEYD